MGGLFKPSTPAVQDPTPLPDNEQLTKARKRKMSANAASGGYQSTVLSSAGGKETLGA